MDMVLDIVLHESDCRLALYVSFFDHDLYLPYLMPYIKPWVYSKWCC